MTEPNDNAIKGTPLEELVKQANLGLRIPDRDAQLGPSKNELELGKRISELEEELAAAKQDLQDAQDRLAHVEPVFALAHGMYKIPNPYSQGQKQMEIFEYFRKHRYADWYEENGL